MANNKLWQYERLHLALVKQFLALNILSTAHGISFSLFCAVAFNQWIIPSNTQTCTVVSSTHIRYEKIHVFQYVEDI